eukprot:EG_transcript_4214
MSKRLGPPARPAGAPPAKVARPDTASTQALLLQYHAEGRLDTNRLDYGIVKALHALGEAGVVEALEKFCETDLTQVQNHAGFLKKIINGVSAAHAAGGGAVLTSLPTSAAGESAILELLADHHSQGLLDMTELDEQATAELGALPLEQAIQVLQVYEETDLTAVPDRSAFLRSIIAEGTVGPAAPGELDPAVRAELDAAVEQGCLSADNCDGKLLASLAALPPATGLKALQEFVRIATTAPVKLPNPGVFLAATIRRHQKAVQRQHAPEGLQLEAALQKYQREGLLQENEFDEGILADLQAIPLGVATQALAEYVKCDQSNIRNKQGFMKGIIRHLLQDYAAPPAAAAPPPSAPPQPRAKAHHNHLAGLLSHYKAYGVIADGDLDEGIIGQLAQLPEDMAVKVFEEYATADQASIRNKSAFMKGILNRVALHVLTGAPLPTPRTPGMIPGGAGRLAPVAPVARPPPPPPPPRRQGPAAMPLEQFLAPFFAAGRLAPNEFDDVALEQLDGLSPELRQTVVSEYLQADRSSVRNPSSYLMGIIKHVCNPAAAAPLGPSRGPYTLNPSAARPPARLPLPPRAAVPQPRGPALARPPVARPVAGRPFPRPGPPAPQRPSPATAAAAGPTGRLFCPSCGFQQPAANFCVKCGFSLKAFLAGV